MKKNVLLCGALVISLLLVGCESKKEGSATTNQSSNSDTSVAAKKQSITYLNKDYQVNIPTKKIVTASIEAMEDAAALGVKPLGAVTVGGEIPHYLSSALGSEIVNVGDKFGPNVEVMTSLQPDVILGSTKFDESVTKNLEKIAPTINVSHQSSTWKENLSLLGKLSGKEEKAQSLVSDYEKELMKTKKTHAAISDLSVVILRVRGGELCLYGSQVYYNPMLYDELGFKKPETIDKVKGQETISIEQFAKINPDIVFVQFAADENKGHESFIKELKANPIWKSMTATKKNKVYFDVVDGGYQGGTYLSKAKMLEQLNKKVLK